MVTPELLDFIKSQLKYGNTPESISATLVAQGWQVLDVQEGFQKAGYSLQRAEAISVTSGTIPSLLSATLQVVTREWWPLLVLSILTLIIVGLAVMLPGPLIMMLFTYFVKARPDMYTYILGGLGYILFLLISGTLQCWGPLAMIYLILHRNERISTWQSLWRTRRIITRFWSLSLLVILTATGTLGLAFLPTFLAILNTVKANHFQANMFHFTGMPVVLFVLSVVLGVVATSLVMIWTLFSAQSMVDHALSPLDAMVRSKELMTKNMWFVILRMSLVALIVALLVGIILVLTPLLKHTPYAGTVITYIGVFLMVMVGLIYSTLLYEHVRDHRAHAANHATRDKAEFVVLALLGLVLPVTILVVVIVSLGPLFSGFLQNVMTKELQKNSSDLPSPLPSYLQNGEFIPPNTSGF